MKSSSRKKITRLLLTLCAALALANASADGGIRLGAATYPTSGFAVDVHAALPLFEKSDVTHWARADISYAFSGLPAFGVVYQLSGKPDPDAVIERYLGAGLGLSFPAEPVASPLISAHWLAGFRYPIASNFGAFVETSVATHTLGSSLALGVGLDYTFGGSR